ncbi:PEP-CTERM sorting domain-containing protein [Rhodoferax sp. 4810]|nr:PEP-CTERM sorting domain-containing protein [Rhodoferax jenense]
MTIKFALKAGCAAMALAGMASANAGQVYLDIGIDYDPSSTTGQVTTTSTSLKSQLNFQYDSKTVVQDTNSDGVISAGDALVTTGGRALLGDGSLGLLTNNSVTSLIPQESFGTNSDNGYGSPNYVLSFSVTNLAGTISGVTPANVPLFSYQPGVLEMFITEDGVNFDNFMDINLFGGGATGVSTVLFGAVDFTNTTGNYRDFFNYGGGACGGLTSFYDIWNTCGAGALGPMNIDFLASQEVGIPTTEFTYDPTAKTFTLASNHTGNVKFDIPEPGTLALLGLALAGLGMTQRRRKQA